MSKYPSLQELTACVSVAVRVAKHFSISPRARQTNESQTDLPGRTASLKAGSLHLEIAINLL